MNILIIGEFSGFAKHLKRGFELLGHRVVIAHTGDGWKGFEPTGDDIIYGVNPISFWGHPVKCSWRLFVPKENRRIQKKIEFLLSNGIDLIVCVNYTFLSARFYQLGVGINFIKKILNKGSKLIMSECGNSMAGFFFRKDWFETHGYSVRKIKDKRYSFLLDYSTVIIPTTYYYYEQLQAYSSYYPFNLSKVLHSIPLPITIDKEIVVNPINNRKITIFHGIIRPIQKGTPFIQEAMNRLQQEMPEKVECVCKGGMPYEEYIRLFDRVDILIDQVYDNGYGMNAMIGAMNGKCVLNACGPENSEIMGIPKIPFVKIGPDSEQIYKVLRELVLNPQRIDEIKIASRKFAEQYCDSKIIAQRYIESVGLTD
jgi:glycosyltransferase involved in cell wall biosynthesis